MTPAALSVIMCVVEVGYKGDFKFRAKIRNKSWIFEQPSFCMKMTYIPGSKT